MANNETSQQVNTSLFGVPTSNNSDPSTELSISLTVIQISPVQHVLAGCGLIFMMLALALNGFVLHAINLNVSMKNKVKFIIRNSICADIFLAVICGTRALPVIVGNFIEDGLVPTVCLETLYGLLIGYSALAQICSSLVVAVDRFTSVWRPLQYHTSEYSRLVRFLIICFSWIVSLLLTLPSIWIDRAVGIVPPNSHACFVFTLENSIIYYTKVVPAMIWAGLVIVIAIFLTIFALIFSFRKKRENLKESSKEANLRKSSISMTMTFLIVQLIYIACYLPAIISSLLVQPVEGNVFPQLDHTNNLLIMGIYGLNSVVDPLVYILRIQQIRDCLKNYLKPNEHHPSNVN